jgi:RNA recognition motif-containing protein
VLNNSGSESDNESDSSESDEPDAPTTTTTTTQPVPDARSKPLLCLLSESSSDDEEDEGEEGKKIANEPEIPHTTTATTKQGSGDESERAEMDTTTTPSPPTPHAPIAQHPLATTSSSTPKSSVKKTPQTPATTTSGAGCEVWVGNLPRTATEAMVREAFDMFDGFTGVRLTFDKKNNCRGFGFITFQSPEAAKKILGLSHKVNQQQVFVKLSEPITPKAAVEAESAAETKATEVTPLPKKPPARKKRVVPVEAETAAETKATEVTTPLPKKPPARKKRVVPTSPALPTPEAPVAKKAPLKKRKVFADKTEAESSSVPQWRNCVRVGGLPKGTTNPELAAYIGNFGAVSAVMLRTEDDSAYVAFLDSAPCTQLESISKVGGLYFKGQPLACQKMEAVTD